MIWLLVKICLCTSREFNKRYERVIKIPASAETGLNLQPVLSNSFDSWARVVNNLELKLRTKVLSWSGLIRI